MRLILILILLLQAVPSQGGMCRRLFDYRPPTQQQAERGFAEAAKMADEKAGALAIIDFVLAQGALTKQQRQGAVFYRRLLEQSLGAKERSKAVGLARLVGLAELLHLRLPSSRSQNAKVVAQLIRERSLDLLWTSLPLVLRLFTDLKPAMALRDLLYDSRAWRSLLEETEGFKSHKFFFHRVYQAYFDGPLRAIDTLQATRRFSVVRPLAWTVVLLLLRAHPIKMISEQLNPISTVSAYQKGLAEHLNFEFRDKDVSLLIDRQFWGYWDAAAGYPLVQQLGHPEQLQYFFPDARSVRVIFVDGFQAVQAEVARAPANQPIVLFAHGMPGNISVGGSGVPYRLGNEAPSESGLSDGKNLIVWSCGVGRPDVPQASKPESTWWNWVAPMVGPESWVSCTDATLYFSLQVEKAPLNGTQTFVLWAERTTSAVAQASLVLMGDWFWQNLNGVARKALGNEPWHPQLVVFRGTSEALEYYPLLRGLPETSKGN